MPKSGHNKGGGPKGFMSTTRIDLGLASVVQLGRLTLHPAIRAIRHDDGSEEVVEPRAMQVLIALVEKSGDIVRREELIERCWEGRVVGNDAINRVVYRLRQVAEGIGADSFRVETVIKVGYRLIVASGLSDEPFLRGQADHAGKSSVSRRGWLIGGSAAASLAVAGAGFLGFKTIKATKPKTTPEVSMLLQQAGSAYREGGFENRAQAIGLYRKVVAIQPDLADAWGMLGLSYANGVHDRAPDVVADMASHANSAIAKAFALEPKNAFALTAKAHLLSRLGNWRAQEVLLLEALARAPKSDIVNQALATLVLGAVGRCSEAVAALDNALRFGPATPSIAFVRIQQLWASGRLEEADRASDDAYALFPANIIIWFTRFYLWLFTNRVAKAIVFAEDVGGRPAGVPASSFELILQAARALASKNEQDVRLAVDAHVKSAHHGAGFAENAIQFASAVGDIETAYAIAQSYYFGEGFETGEQRFSDEQKTFLRQDDRRAFFLFLPTMAAFRADARFGTLTDRVGLTRYWQQSGTTPDFRRAVRA